MSKYKKPVCFNAIRAMTAIEEQDGRIEALVVKVRTLEAENEQLRKDKANLEIRCRILEADKDA